MQSGAQQRILIISHDVVGSRMAGTGIRYWELAHVLAQKHLVTLIAPQPIDLPPPAVTSGSYQWGDPRSLEPWLEADIVIANGFVLLEHAHLADLPQPLALDLYDPVLLENLELWRHQDAHARERQNTQDHALLQRQLTAGDFFMCATERQRDLLIGALMGAGRITHAVTDHDPTLRGLIDVVPFGLSSIPPQHQAPALRTVVEGIGADDALLLWTGGLWDWMDPQTLVEAMPAVVARHPEARLVFLAGQHPGAIQPMRAPAATRQRAAELGLLDIHIFFYDQWIPYEARSSFLLEADIAVSLHHNHLETAYAAVRSRFLDHLWAGLPSVVADGDAAADLVRAHALGTVVPTGDVGATADALVRLLDEPANREQYAANARSLAQRYTWDRTVEPLVHFCNAPRRTRAVPEPVIASTQPPEDSHHVQRGAIRTMQHDQEQLIKQMEGLWQFGALPETAGNVERLVQRAVLRVLGPFVGQQRDFNATLVKLVYTLRDRQDNADTYLNSMISQLVTMQHELQILRTDLREIGATLHKRIDIVAAHGGEVSARLDTVEKDLHGRLDTTAEILGSVSARLDTLERDIHGRLDTTAEFLGSVSARLDALHRDAHERLDTLGEWGGELNDRLTRLVYSTQLLDEAVVAGDEIDAELASQIASMALQAQNVASDPSTQPGMKADPDE